MQLLIIGNRCTFLNFHIILFIIQRKFFSFLIKLFELHWFYNLYFLLETPLIIKIRNWRFIAVWDLMLLYNHRHVVCRQLKMRSLLIYIMIIKVLIAVRKGAPELVIFIWFIYLFRINLLLLLQSICPASMLLVKRHLIFFKHAP